MSTRISIIALAALAAIPVSANAQRWYYHPYRHPVVIVERAPTRQEWHVRTLVDDAERDSNSMRHVFEVDLDHMNRRERDHLYDAKSAIQRLDESFEQLRRNADDYRPHSGREQMRTVLDRAADVSVFMNRRGEVRDIVGRRWDDLRADIDRLADMYGLDRVAR